jgi:hypothetical protein
MNAFSVWYRNYCFIFLRGSTAAWVENGEGFSFEQSSSPGKSGCDAGTDNGELAEDNDGFA